MALKALKPCILKLKRGIIYSLQGPLDDDFAPRVVCRDGRMARHSVIHVGIVWSGKRRVYGPRRKPSERS